MEQQWGRGVEQRTLVTNEAPDDTDLNNQPSN